MTDAIQVIKAVREVAAEQPDHVYRKPDDASNCHYVDRDNGDRVPGCLVGQGLWKVGLIDGSLFDDYDVNGAGVAGILDYVQIDCLPIQSEWLERVQNRQDAGATWGEAVAYADSRTREMHADLDDDELAEWVALPVRV